jgi:hypothetical protein
VKDKTKTRFYFLLRFFRKGRPEQYAYDQDPRGSRRSWYHAKARRSAYQFPNRGDARRVLQSPAFKELLLGKRNGYRAGRRDEDTRHFWEIIKVTETIVTSFEEEIIVSDAPAMLTIARATQ